MDSSQITELRNMFLDQLSSKGSDAVHPKDLERAKNDDNWLHRFLLQHDNNVTGALNMMWETVTWRKEFRANEINDLVKTDIIVKGGFFPHGRDKDGSTLFVFKCKNYIKGTYDMDDLKRCVVYWFERLERQDKGKPITLFFDMEGCGLANMDLEFTKYLIGLFKQYYPYFLNYILIFEMPWILNAAFKIIKSWLPEKAVQKIKFVSKKDIKEYVPLDQALKCWGGQNDYTFSFLPDPAENPISVSTPIPTNRKVHFADGSSMSESPEGSGDKDHDGSALSVQPSSIITFTKEGGELVSTLELQNIDSSIVLSFKLKTTSPEKFRVRPSVGCLTPGARATVHVTLLPGFQLGGLSRDKFLVMSTVIDSDEMNQDLALLWKDTTGRKINQHRLKCAQTNDIPRNGNAVVLGGSSEGDTNNNNQLLSKINNLTECQSQLHGAVKRIHYFQIATVALVVALGILVAYVIHLERQEGYSGSCTAP